MINIIAIGKKHEPWVLDGITRYEKRLLKPWNIQWTLLPHSSYEGAMARQEESERIIARLTPTDYVILLDETGKQLTTPKCSALCDTQFTHSTPVTFIIGGAYGVDATIHERANTVLSLSTMVFPHQLVRLILAEQIYRMQEINRGSNYHHV